eukprot:COSAG02_NODE_652_length_18867_cov_30.656756_3_plen_62_part_00
MRQEGGDGGGGGGDGGGGGGGEAAELALDHARGVCSVVAWDGRAARQGEHALGWGVMGQVD